MQWSLPWSIAAHVGWILWGYSVLARIISASLTPWFIHFISSSAVVSLASVSVLDRRAAQRIGPVLATGTVGAFACAGIMAANVSTTPFVGHMFWLWLVIPFPLIASLTTSVHGWSYLFGAKAVDGLIFGTFASLVSASTPLGVIVTAGFDGGEESRSIWAAWAVGTILPIVVGISIGSARRKVALWGTLVGCVTALGVLGIYHAIIHELDAIAFLPYAGGAVSASLSTVALVSRCFTRSPAWSKLLAIACVICALSPCSGGLRWASLRQGGETVVGVIGDPHCGQVFNSNRCAGTIKQIGRFAPSCDCIIVTGDLLDEHAEWEQVESIDEMVQAGTEDTKVILLHGNHDRWVGGIPIERIRLLNGGPIYKEACGGVDVFVLGEYPAKAVSRWLKASGRRNARPTIVAFHYDIPDRMFPQASLKAFEDALDSLQPALVAHGHLHVTFFRRNPNRPQVPIVDGSGSPDMKLIAISDDGQLHDISAESEDD